jgi:hypothetical protein
VISEQLLTILKYVLLALVWLFFLRVVRAVWVEVRGTRVLAAGNGSAPAADHERRRGRRRRERPVKPVKLRLAVVEPKELRGRWFPLSDEVTVGRAPGCAVALPEDTFTSQLHARVFLRDGRLYVEDLGSTNGTYLNAKRVTAPTPLRRGDRLQVGRTVLEVSR